MNDLPNMSSPLFRGKFWLKSYLPNTPPEIDPSQLPTLKVMCEAACARHADSLAFTQGEKSLSFADLEQLSRSFGAWLQSIGGKKGDRVALMLPNVIEFPIALFGVLRVGMAVVTVNPLYTPREVRQLLDDSRPIVLVTLDGLRAAIDFSANDAGLRYIVTIGGSDAARSERSAPARSNDVQHILWNDAVRTARER